MAVYVDEAIWHWKGRRWCHLMADDLDELHRFAARLGIHRRPIRARRRRTRRTTTSPASSAIAP